MPDKEKKKKLPSKIKIGDRDVEVRWVAITAPYVVTRTSEDDETYGEKIKSTVVMYTPVPVNPQELVNPEFSKATGQNIFKVYDDDLDDIAPADPTDLISRKVDVQKVNQGIALITLMGSAGISQRDIESHSSLRKVLSQYSSEYRDKAFLTADPTSQLRAIKQFVPSDEQLGITGLTRTGMEINSLREQMAQETDPKKQSALSVQFNTAMAAYRAASGRQEGDIDTLEERRARQRALIQSEITQRLLSNPQDFAAVREGQEKLADVENYITPDASQFSPDQVTGFLQKSIASLGGDRYRFLTEPVAGPTQLVNLAKQQAQREQDEEIKKRGGLQGIQREWEQFMERRRNQSYKTQRIGRL